MRTQGVLPYHNEVTSRDLYHSDRRLFTFPVVDLKGVGVGLKEPVRWPHGEKHLLPNDKSLVT